MKENFGPKQHISKQLLTLVSVAALMLSTAEGISAETITLSGISRCPYICSEEPARPGFLIEIVKAAFNPEGISIRLKKLPWSRAVRYAKSGKITGLIGIQRKGYTTMIFPLEEQAFEQLRFYVKKGNPWRFSGLSSLRKIKLGATQDYSYGEMDSYIKKYRETPAVQSIPGSNTLARHIRLLETGRITAILEDYVVIDYTLKQIDKTGNFSEAGVLSGENIYIAFSPAATGSKKYAEILSRAMPRLRKTGELEKIMKIYGLRDWK